MDILFIEFWMEVYFILWKKVLIGKKLTDSAADGFGINFDINSYVSGYID